MLELFQKILKDNLTPNQLLLLIGKNENISFQIHQGMKDFNYDRANLLSLKLVEIDESDDNRLKMTAKGKRICAKYNNLYSVRKKRTSIQLMGKGYNEMLKIYREVFPSGKLPSGKPARQNVKTLENAFRWFFDTYDYTWDEVSYATIMYVNEYKNKDYMYMKTSQYFICKSDKNKVKHSELADYCDMVRDGIEIQDDHFKENVV